MPWKNSRRQPIEPQLPPDLPGGPALPKRQPDWAEGGRWVVRALLRAGLGLLIACALFVLLCILWLGWLLVWDHHPPKKPLPGMSADLADFTVGYGGDVYALPAPLEGFLQNGWELRRRSEEEAELWMGRTLMPPVSSEEELAERRAWNDALPEDPEIVLPPGEERDVRLVRGDDEAVLTVWNPGPQPQPLRGCLVYRITAVSYRDPPLMIAGGITQYTDSHYLESLLEPLAPPHVDAEGSRWYTLEYGQGCYYEAVVPWPTFDISSITVCNRPPTRAMPNGPAARGVFLPPVCYTVKKAEQGGTPYAHPDGTAARP